MFLRHRLVFQHQGILPLRSPLVIYFENVKYFLLCEKLPNCRRNYCIEPTDPKLKSSMKMNAFFCVSYILYSFLLFHVVLHPDWTLSVGICPWLYENLFICKMFWLYVVSCTVYSKRLRTVASSLPLHYISAWKFWLDSGQNCCSYPLVRWVAILREKWECKSLL